MCPTDSNRQGNFLEGKGAQSSKRYHLIQGADFVGPRFSGYDSSLKEQQHMNMDLTLKVGRINEVM